MESIAKLARVMSDLTEEMNVALRRAMQAWIDADPDRDRTALARLINRSQPSISDFLNEVGGASFKTAREFAAATGQDVWTVLGGSGASVPTVIPGQLPNWPAAEATARRLRPHLGWAIRGAREMVIWRAPTKVTPSFVLRLARLFRDISTEQERMRLDELERRPAPESGRSVVARLSDRPTNKNP